MKYLSLFSGLGGFELGIGDKAECIGYSEIDRYAIQIYNKHFNHYNYGDITKIKPESLQDFELLVGGFPCQAFSIAGKRGGFSDTRGTLFFEIARIVKQKQPRLLLLENVKGLLSHNKGATFTTIISTLDELGYDCQWQVLNSKNFGVPQNRERVFIVGHLRRTSRPKVFPIGGSNPKNLKQIIGGGQGNRVYDTDGLSTTQASLAGGQGAKTGLYAVPLKYLDRNQKNFQGDYSFTVDTCNTGGVAKNMAVRRLTPKECERLQGFPDDWTKYGVVDEMPITEPYKQGKSVLKVTGKIKKSVEISDTQRYKCLGNAVTVNIIQAIMEKLLGDKLQKKETK